LHFSYIALATAILLYYSCGLATEHNTVAHKYDSTDSAGSHAQIKVNLLYACGCAFNWCA